MHYVRLFMLSVKQENLIIKKVMSTYIYYFCVAYVLWKYFRLMILFNILQITSEI